MVQRFRTKLAAAALLTWCCVGEKPAAPDQAMTPASRTMSDDEPDRSPIDARIAGLADATNSVLIEQAKVAWGRGRNERIRDFAQQQVSRHEDAALQQSRIESELRLVPIVSEHSATLRARGQQEVARLLAVDHDDFDIEYLDTQLRWYKEALRLYDIELMPYSKHSKLKATLSAQRELLVSEREELRRIFDLIGPTPFGPNSIPAL